MQDIRTLMMRGFLIEEAVDAADCTQVSSEKPFYYFNPRFADKPDELVHAIYSVGVDAKSKRYRMVVAGTYYGKKDLPYSILTEDEYIRLNQHHREMSEARRAFSDSHSALVQVIRDLDMP